jgi:hypothetical protein
MLKQAELQTDAIGNCFGFITLLYVHRMNSGDSQTSQKQNQKICANHVEI